MSIKGRCIGGLPGTIAAKPRSIPAPASRVQPGPPGSVLTQHGQQKGTPVPLAEPLAPPRFPLNPRARPRTARIIGPDNGRGLSQDRALLTERLRAGGWEVMLLEGVPPSSLERVTLQIHLEVPAGPLFPLAPHNVLVPNPEWWRPEWAPLLSCPGVQVWAKTAHTERLFQSLRAQVRRIGWRSADRQDLSVARRRAFLHVAGASPHKGTELLLRTWQPGWPPLTIVSSQNRAAPQANVTIRGRLSEGELRQLQNEHAFHVYPVRYEGYGHAEWEGLSCGAVVFCTDGPPFDEHPEAFRLLPATPGPHAGLAILRDVAPEALAAAVTWADGLSTEALSTLQQQSRRAWEAAGAAFEGCLGTALAELSPQRLITLQSPHERCGIAEYGRQLDQALAAGGMVPRTLPLSVVPETLLAACGPGTVLLLHYEPGLIDSGLGERLRAARSQGARIVFCCHLFEPQVLSVWGGLVDRFVIHRPYPGVPSGKVVEIPLGCPEYELNEDRGALRARLGLPQDRLVLTTLGFLSPWKRLPETLGLLLERLPASVYVQVLTPPPFRDSASAEIGRVHQALARHRAGPDRVLFSTEFRSERELLDRVAASDLGFLFHGQHTGSVSAATKSFVSGRTPLVATGSSHAADLQEGVVRVGSLEIGGFVAEVVRVAQEEALRATLRAGMEREYSRLRMTAVARRYVELLRSLS